LGEVSAAALAERGLEWGAMRVKHLKDVFLSKGERAARFVPNELTWKPAVDELYPARTKIALSFVLPKGSYATILVKRVTL
jgi:tRNA pseudouridine13 synthase